MVHSSGYIRKGLTCTGEGTHGHAGGGMVGWRVPQAVYSCATFLTQASLEKGAPDQLRWKYCSGLYFSGWARLHGARLTAGGGGGIRGERAGEPRGDTSGAAIQGMGVALWVCWHTRGTPAGGSGRHTSGAQAQRVQCTCTFEDRVSSGWRGGRQGLGWGVGCIVHHNTPISECDNVGARCPLGACTTHGSVVVTSTLSVVVA